VAFSSLSHPASDPSHFHFLNHAIEKEQAVAVHQSQRTGLSHKYRPEALLTSFPLSFIMISKAFKRHSVPQLNLCHL
jgi:hypothetical protein